MLRGFVLGDDPDVGGDAGVVEAVVGELHNGIQPVALDQVPADLRLTGPGVPGEQGGAVLDDGHAALRFQLGQAVEQEQHLPVALAGKAGTEAASGRPGPKRPAEPFLCSASTAEASRFQSMPKGGLEIQ